jgi:aminoglycoside phosphotransferase (APT) family kinase protein
MSPPRNDEIAAHRLMELDHPELGVISAKRIKKTSHSMLYEMECSNSPNVVVCIRPDLALDMAAEELPLLVAAYKTMSATGVLVPSILYSHANPNPSSPPVVAYPYLVMTKLDGQPADTALQERGMSESGHIFRAIGQALSRIHQVEAPWVGCMSLGSASTRHTDWWQCLLSQTDKYEHSIVSSSQRTSTILYLRRSLSEMASGSVRLTFVHNDYFLQNILVKRQNEEWVVSGVLDLEWAFYGDADWDLACFYWYLRDRDWQKREKTFDTFKSAYYGGLKKTAAYSRARIKSYALLRLFYVESKGGHVYDEDFKNVMRWDISG